MTVTEEPRRASGPGPIRERVPRHPGRAFEPDELDVWYFRHRHVLIGLFLVIFSLLIALSSVATAAIPDLPHVFFKLCAGDRDVFSQTLFASGALDVSAWNLVIVALYVALQAIALWGIGTVYVRREPHPYRTAAATAAISAIGGLLAVGFVALLIMAFQVSSNKFNSHAAIDLDSWKVILIVIGVGWAFWVAVAALYCFGKDKENVAQRLLRAVMATSWIEFSLALPMDISARNRESCYCAIGSYGTLLVSLPVLIWTIGPALYLLYLRERHFSLRHPSRVKMILRAKTRRYRQQPARRAENYVSTARTTSLAVIVLGFVGLQLGLFNFQRGTSFAETRDLILIQVITQKYGNDATLSAELEKAGEATPESGGKSLKFTDQSLGSIEITGDASAPLPTSGQPDDSRQGPGQKGFSATVSNTKQTWQSRSFLLDRQDNEQRLDRALAALSIDEDKNTTPDKLIRKVGEAIYSRKVKLPSVDFGEFGTEWAVWAVTLLCLATLVALRNAVSQIFRSPDTGIAEAWLVLDARAFGEKVIAGAWLAGIGLSAWLSIFGLILTAMDAFALATPRPSLVQVLLSFVVFAAFLALATWAAVGTVADLLRLRLLRRMLEGDQVG